VRAGFWEPGGLALSPDGATLYVADTNNGAIRRVDTASGSVTTLGVGGIGALLAASGGGGASGAAPAGGGATRLITNRARARLLPAPDGVAFAPAADGSLSLRVHLPPGGRWTDGAPSRWQVNATAAGGGDATARLAAGAVTQTGPAEGSVDVAGLALPAAADGGGVEVEARLYYCGTDGVCRMEAVVWAVPVAAGGGDAVALERPAGGRA